MAAMEQAFCIYLLTKTAITDIIGAGSSARLWPLALPQNFSVTEGAAATYTLIDGDEEHHLAGRAGFVQSRLQIATFAETVTEAMELARAIKNCGVTELKGVSSSVDFREITIVRGIQTFQEQPTDGSGEYRALADFDFQITYLE